MKTINAAVILRGRDLQSRRLPKTGWWTYPVEGFTWTLYGADDGSVFYRDKLAAAGHDVIIYEDWQWSAVIGPGLPLVYVIVDSNTSEKRHQWYRRHARGLGVDLILLDQDKPKRFRDIAPALHWGYGVNERVWSEPDTKPVDVAYHCAKTAERGELGHWLAAFRDAHPQWLFKINSNMPIPEYIQAIRQAKLVVHIPTKPQCRTHRIFDALASGGCLLSSVLPTIPGDDFEPGHHYVVWQDEAMLGRQIINLLETGTWKHIARQGREFVLSRHTWAHKAAELHTILGEAFPWLN